MYTAPVPATLCHDTGSVVHFSADAIRALQVCLGRLLHLEGTRASQRTMSNQPERFTYPFTATTVLARKLVPFLLFTMGVGLFLWSAREYYFWARPWAFLPEAALGLLCWLAAAYFYTLLPEIHAGEGGLRVRRWGLLWRRIPWTSVAEVRGTAQVDLLGWAESLYTVYVWRTVPGRRGRVRREWHRRPVRAFRFSGHIRNCDRLLGLIGERVGPAPGPSRDADIDS